MGNRNDATIVPFLVRRSALANCHSVGPKLRQDLGTAVLAMLQRWGIQASLGAKLLGLDALAWEDLRARGALPAEPQAIHAACDLLKLRRLVEGTRHRGPADTTGMTWLNGPLFAGHPTTRLDLLASGGIAAVRELCRRVHGHELGCG